MSTPIWTSAAAASPAANSACSTSNEQKDLYDVIEWLGHQQWSNGKVGGIGQSYFCMSQWWMAIQKPPSLACIAAFDGLNDPYRASVYQGGILGDFFGSYWWNQNRIINRHPANGEAPREQDCDLNLLIQQHPTYDDFWRERSAAERLHEIEVPLYSVGVWGKVDLHTRGNIDGFRRAKGPKKLKMIGPINAFVANREFNSPELHEKLLLPFYDHYLKGKETDYAKRPAVEYFVRGADAVRTAETWPPPGLRYVTWHLSAEKSGSVTSLNDGTLSRAAASGEEQDLLQLSQSGLDDGRGRLRAEQPARSGAPRADLHHRAARAGCGDRRPDQARAARSDRRRNDMDFFVKLSEQMPQAADDRAKGLNPASYWITKGWLRASHRALDPSKSSEMEPYHTPQRSDADRAWKNLPLRHQRRADGASLQEGQSDQAGDRQRRFGGHRCSVDALLRAQQDRHRHHLPLGAVSVGADAAGDGRRLSKAPARPKI